MKIFYFGKPFSFSHIAGLKRFGTGHDYVPCDSVKDVTAMVMEFGADKCVGIIPAENSHAGAILDFYSLATGDDPMSRASLLEWMS